MKFFKNTLVIIALFTINFANAKVMKKPVTTTPTTQPIPASTQPPIIQPSFAPSFAESSGGHGKATEGRPKPAPQTRQPAVQKPITERKAPQPIQPSFTKSGVYPEPVEGEGRQKKVVEPKTKPIEPTKISSIKEFPPTHNLILLLDPKKVETINRYGNAMVNNALMGFYEQAAPIIMSSNILEIINIIKQKVGEQNFKQLRNSPYNMVQQFAQQLVQKYDIHESLLTLILMSLINFDDKSLHYYFHKSDHLVLVIPENYMKTSFSHTSSFNSEDEVKACGFNPNLLTKVTNATPENLLQQLKAQQSKPVNKDRFIENLTALFIPQKKYGKLIAPEQDTEWDPYISGHGGPTYLIVGNTYQVVPEKGNVVGVSLQEFSQLMHFFDENLNVAYLHYTTCFSGGYSQVFVNDILSSLDVDFIVSSEGLGEKETTGIPLAMRFSSVKPYIQLQFHPFTEFFKLLRFYIGQPKEFIKIKEGKKEPIAQIIRALNPHETENTQPFVRFPGKGVFGALSISKNTKVLTERMVKEHEAKHRPIDMSNKDIGIIMVNPSRINSAMNIGDNTDCAIATPTVMTKSQQTIHVFKEINWKIQLQELIFNFVRLNPKMHTQFFVVKKVTDILYQQSNLPSSSATINNLIIKIDGMMGTGIQASPKPSVQTKPLLSNDIPIAKLGANVNVIFELNNNLYQYNVALKTFDDLNEIVKKMKQISFSSQPLTTNDIQSVATKFLTPQEINKLKNPITLENIADSIGDKINMQ